MMKTRLTNKEKQICQQIFDRFDKDGNGTIDVGEIRSALKAIGRQASDEDLFLVMSEADADGSGVIEFQEFLKAIERQKMSMDSAIDEHSTIDAFVALGGNADKSGKISLEKLRSTLLAFDLMPNVQLFDKDGSGFIEFDEFEAIVG